METISRDQKDLERKHSTKVSPTFQYSPSGIWSHKITRIGVSNKQKEKIKYLLDSNGIYSTVTYHDHPTGDMGAPRILGQSAQYSDWSSRDKCSTDDRHHHQEEGRVKVQHGQHAQGA